MALSDVLRSLLKNVESRKERQEFSFNTNIEKIKEAIVWVASQRPRQVDIYKTVKTIFYADVYHLEQYGRPITGDVFCALPFGPVPSTTYDMLKPENAVYFQDAFSREGNLIIANRVPDPSYLTKSDVKCLQRAWDEIKDKSFDEIYDTSHEHEAYQKAWARKGYFRKSSDMYFSEIITDKDKLEYLREYAKKIRI